ncbi:anthranilate phosphoribosyltransferase [Acarospora aff. strigata]|nr:anthranilate phosphoribosyltransferase [Acarospora aff. strigata]
MDAELAPCISIAPLLKQLDSRSSEAKPTAGEIALALSHIFTNQLSPIQTTALLTYLHVTGRDHEADIIAKCAERMRDAATQVDKKALRELVRARGRKEGGYRGGLCDIVGTGGDGHSTFNISTTASILASSLLLLSKHGNRASSSTSGSADLLLSILPIAPKITAVNNHNLLRIYAKTNYAFLFAPTFHPGMKHVAPIRKELGFRTIFNLLGPLANPVESVIEARVVGVAEGALGYDYAEALRLSGAKKAMVVCGTEELDEISCAGSTNCWRLVERPNPQFRGPKDEADEDYTTSDDDAPPRTLVKIEKFQLGPSDFGLPQHALSDVSPGKLPHQNAEILLRLLRNEMPREDPILHFVLMNTAALFVIAGVCDANTSDMGYGDDGKVIDEMGPGGGRWKEGIRRARWAVESGEALRSLMEFIHISNSFDTQ